MSSASIEMTEVEGIMGAANHHEEEDDDDEEDAVLMIQSKGRAGIVKTTQSRQRNLLTILLILLGLTVPWSIFAIRAYATRSPTFQFSVQSAGGGSGEDGKRQWKKRGQSLQGPTKSSENSATNDLDLALTGDRLVWTTNEGITIADWHPSSHQWKTVSSIQHTGRIVSIDVSKDWIVAAQSDPEHGTMMWDVETGSLNKMYTLAEALKHQAAIGILGQPNQMISRVNNDGFVITSFQTDTVTGSVYYSLKEGTPLGSVMEPDHAMDSLSMDFQGQVHVVCYRRWFEAGEEEPFMKTIYMAYFVGREEMVPTAKFQAPYEEIETPRACALSESGQTLAVLARLEDQSTELVTYTLKEPLSQDDLMNDLREDPEPGPTSVVSPPRFGAWQSMAVSGSGTRIALADSQNEISVLEWRFSEDNPEWVQVGDALLVVDEEGQELSGEIMVEKIILKLSSDGQTLVVGVEMKADSTSTSFISIFQLEDKVDRV